MDNLAEQSSSGKKKARCTAVLRPPTHFRVSKSSWPSQRGPVDNTSQCHTCLGARSENTKKSRSKMHPFFFRRGQTRASSCSCRLHTCHLTYNQRRCNQPGCASALTGCPILMNLGHKPTHRTFISCLAHLVLSICVFAGWPSGITKPENRSCQQRASSMKHGQPTLAAPYEELRRGG